MRTEEQEHHHAMAAAHQQDLDRQRAESTLDTSKMIERLTDIKNVADGWVNPLSAYIALKRVCEHAALMMDDVKNLAIDEAQKHGQKEFEAFGARVAVRNSAGKWDFSEIPQWNAAKQRLADVQELAKSALANKKHGTTIIDEATGEVIEPAIYTEGPTNIFIRLL